MIHIRAFIVVLLIGLSVPAQASTRRALLIGINKYNNVTQLANAVADAQRMEDVLTRLGYVTTLVAEEKTDRSDLLQVFSKFTSQLVEGDDAVIYYAGHGVEVNGANYLVPKDVPSPDSIGDDASLPDYLIPFARLIDLVKRRDVNGNIWIIDACRNNPFDRPGRDLGGGSGLGGYYGPAGTFLFYSAEANRKALDRLPGDAPDQKNGVYTRAFSELVMEHRSDDVHDLARLARIRVRDMTDGFQRPSYYDSLDNAWCFAACKQVLASTSLQTAQKTIPDPTLREISEATVPQEQSNHEAARIVQPNVVIIGKKSALPDCVKRSADSAPFGCDVLRDAIVPSDPSATIEQTRAKLFGRDLVALTGVNVRLRAPTVQEKVGAVYSCIVRTLNEREAVRLSGIIEVNVGSDTYYWGALEGTPQDCRKTVKQ
jgi:hypothetical protein